MSLVKKRTMGTNGKAYSLMENSWSAFIHINQVWFPPALGSLMDYTIKDWLAHEIYNNMDGIRGCYAK